MEGRGGLIAAIIVIILVLAVVFGTVFYLSRAFGVNLNPFGGGLINRSTPKPKATSLPLPTAVFTSSPSETVSPGTGGTVPTAHPTPNVTAAPSGDLIYKGQGFELTYPKSWGLLTCTTSQNIEFDPYNNARVTIPCDRAIKPITILVNQGASCQGETVKIGSHQVIKSKTQYRDWLTHLWCISKGEKSFDISHRVSQSGQIGTSKDDFSAQVEQIISTFKIQ